MKKRISVLSIDGGGIYGIVSAMVLAEIEQMTGRHIASFFDLIAGTSTGGIIALGLTMPDPTGKKPRYSASDMVKLYETKGDQIFSRTLLHTLMAVGTLLDEKYPSRGIDRTLKNYFGESALSDVLTDVLITAYNIENRDAYFFKSQRAKIHPDRNFYLRDIARATSAAPTYFEPVKIKNVPQTQEAVLVDGGVFANNPTMCAYAEIKHLYPEVEELCFVSIGTSGAREPYRYEKAKDWGAAEWIVPALDIIRNGVQDTVDYQMQQIFPTDPKKVGMYTRIQPLTVGKIQMDDISIGSIRLLKEFAGKYLENNHDLLESLSCHLLEER